MTTLPPPKTEPSPEDSLEKKVYNIVEKYKEYLPIANDRNRLGFSLYKYVTGEGDDPKTLVKSAKVLVDKISTEELAVKIESDISQLKK